MKNILGLFSNTKGNKVNLVPVITKIFPNPSHGPVTIELEGDVSQLRVLDSDLRVLKAFAITGSEIHFDLSSWPRGIYIFVAHYGANQSDPVQLILQ